jgi:hypothetical protein
LKNAEPVKPAQPVEKEPGILQPLVDEMTKPKPAPEPAKAPVPPPHAPQPAEQDQDSGGGYNPDHTVPQP